MTVLYKTHEYVYVLYYNFKYYFFFCVQMYFMNDFIMTTINTKCKNFNSQISAGSSWIRRYHICFYITLCVCWRCPRFSHTFTNWFNRRFSTLILLDVFTIIKPVIVLLYTFINLMKSKNREIHNHCYTVIYDSILFD